MLTIEQKDLSHFLPLNEFITYLTNLISPPSHRYKLKELQHIIESNQLKQEMHHFLYNLYNPVIDESIEGDIYSQNKRRSRSIVEEVSNSLDVSPKEIHCTIKDSYYEIREINGLGMTAYTICTSYLLPKESSKINSDKQIGLFEQMKLLRTAALSLSKPIFEIFPFSPVLVQIFHVY